MTLTVTLHAWWLEVWLAVGALLYVPLNEIARRKVTPRRPLADWLLERGFSSWDERAGTYVPQSRRARVRKIGAAFVVQTIGWPLAIWEVLR